MIRETTAPQDITWLKIDEVYPYECNNKIHQQPEITKIANSIKEFGWTYPILIDENNIVLAGHKRLLAAKQIGLTEVPTIRKDDLSDAQKRAYRIIDNKSSEESEYDPTNLTLELDEIKALDFDISKFINLNFDLDKIGEIQDLDVQEDDYDAEPPAEPKTKLGDLYKLGNHYLLCGDATNEEDVRKLMNGKKADMVFTDPPYGYSYQSNMRKKTKKFEILKNDNTYVDFFPVLKNFNEGFVFVCSTWKVIKNWIELFENYYELTNMIIWNKGGGGIGDLKHTFSTDYEIILVSSNNKELVGKRIGCVWNIKKDNANNYIHATQKPIELAATAIQSASYQNNIVLDLFGGSGSTLIACEQLDRQCYMMELDPAYCDVIIDRWEKFTGRKAEKIN